MATPSSSNLKHTCTLLTEGFRSVLQLKMTEPLNITQNTIGNRSHGINSRCSVHGYDWNILSGKQPVCLAGGWWLMLIVLREKYCWLVVGGWFVLREKYCWLAVDKLSEQAEGCHFLRLPHLSVRIGAEERVQRISPPLGSV
jgi:hypothetical protein